MKKSTWDKLKIGISVAYILSPIDLLPESHMGAIGLIDDVIVLGYLINEWRN